MTVLFVLLVVSDRQLDAELDRERQGDGVIVGEVVASERGRQVVRWYDDARDRFVQVETEGMPIGDRVAVVPNENDPVASTFEHGMAGDPVQTLVYLVWFVPPWAWLISRWWNVRRNVRLAAAPVPSFVMWATVVRRSWSTALIRIDATDADDPTDASGAPEPICEVQVVATPFVHATRTRVEVKGNPRPAGRLVLRSDEAIIWPTGRARLRRSVGDAWSAASIHRQVALVATVVAIAAFLAVSLDVVGLRDHEERRRDGRPVEASVVAVVDEIESHLVYELPGEPGVWAGVSHYFWDERELRVGDVVELAVADDDPMHPIPATGPYHHDPAVFGGLGALLLAAAGGGLVWWGAGRDRRTDDRAISSPGGRRPR